MKKTVTVFLVLAMLASLCLCCFACGNKTDESVLRLNEVTHSVFYAPLYAAINLGYFEKYGLKIELTNGGGSDKSMTAILSGGADMALLGPETSVYVNAAGSANGAKIVGQLTQKDGSFLIGRTEQTNFTWASLRDKEIIGGRQGGMPAMCLEYALSKNGLVDKESVFINYDVQFDLITAAFESGVGDYCTMFEPAASQYEKQGKGYVVTSVGKEVGAIAYTCFMATESYIAANRDKVTAFMRAIVDGIDYCNRESAENVANAVKDSFPTTDYDLLVKSAASYKSIDAWTKVPYMTEESFSLLQDVLLRAGTITKKVSYDSVVDNSVLDEIYRKQ